MSILNVEHLSHGFGDRAIFKDVSFRLLKGEHIGLIGANGEGKSTFMSIITGKLMPDEGKVEWAKNVKVGYLDQHAVLTKGMTIRDVLKSAFADLFAMEEKMNTICDAMAAGTAENMDEMMEELGVIQELLMAHDFYIIDSKVDEVGRALGLEDIGMDKDVRSFQADREPRCSLRSFFLQSRIFSCLMSLRTILMPCTLNGLRDTFLNMRMHLSSYHMTFLFSTVWSILFITWRIRSLTDMWVTMISSWKFTR